MANIVPKIEIQSIFFLTSDKQTTADVLAFIEVWNSDTPDFIVNSSGSTGIPKPIRLSKKIALASAKKTGDFFSYQKNETLVMCLPTHTIGAKMQLIRALVCDMQVLICTASRNPIGLIERPCQQISLVPLQLEAILEQTPEKLKLFDSILVGGAPISPSLCEQIVKLGLNVYEGFGMTETYSHIALRKIGEKENYFVALPGITLHATTGCLGIEASHLSPTTYETNDLVELHSPTSFTWLGRSDYAINSGGFKFIPELLEKQLSKTIEVPYFIIGETDAEFGSRVTLYIEDTYTSERQNKLDTICKKLFTPYACPKKIYFISIFERTANGKLDRLATQKKAIES